MKNQKVYRLYDSKAGAHLKSFDARTHEEAIRMVQQVALEPTHQFHLFPGDFTLFCMGEDNDETGRIDYYEASENLGTILSLMSDLEVNDNGA